MMDLVVRVERDDEGVTVTTNSGTVRYSQEERVRAYRREKDDRTGDFSLVLVK